MSEAIRAQLAVIRAQCDVIELLLPAPPDEPAAACDHPEESRESYGGFGEKPKAICKKCMTIITLSPAGQE